MPIDRQTQRLVRGVIREELVRLRKELAGAALGGGILQAGCDGDCGCFNQEGCCAQEGCCGRTKDLEELVDDRLDLLADFIVSHKQPVIKFFKEHGVDLVL